MNNLSSGPAGIGQCDISTSNHMNYDAQKSFPGISTSVPPIQHAKKSVFQSEKPQFKPISPETFNGMNTLSSGHAANDSGDISTINSMESKAQTSVARN